MTTHDIDQVCCVVRDKDNAAIFGYVTATQTAGSSSSQTIAHVFTIDSQVLQLNPLNVITAFFSLVITS